MNKKEFDKLFKWHIGFLKKLVRKRGSVSPQITFFKGDTLYPMVCLGGREEIKTALLYACSQNPEWIAIMNEGYSRVLSFKKEDRERTLTKLAIHKSGDLKRAFESGDTKIKECVLLTLYSKKRGKSMSFEKIGRKLKSIGETENFYGYLTLSPKDPIKEMKKRFSGER